MGGESTSTGKTSQTSQLTPWGPAAGGLTGILGQLGGAIGNINGTPQTDQAFSQLEANAQGPNPYADPTQAAALSQLGGGPHIGGAIGMLTNAFNAASGALSPYASGGVFNSPALAQMRAANAQDVMNSVNPMFAAAGRLGSPDNYQALARGITQGETGLLGKAADQQIQAGGMLGNLGSSTASGMTGADVANAGIQGQGIGNAATAYGVQNLGPQALLQAALGQQQMPIQNASALAGILGPLAGMFGQQTGSGTQSGTQTMSGAQQFGQIAGGLGNLSKFLWGG